MVVINHRNLPLTSIGLDALQRKVKCSDADADDVVMEERQESSSPKKVDIDRADDLLRFVFREGMPFLDNGSGRCFAERISVDMSGFMVNMLF